MADIWTRLFGDRADDEAQAVWDTILDTAQGVGEGAMETLSDESFNRLYGDVADVVNRVTGWFESRVDNAAGTDEVGLIAALLGNDPDAADRRPTSTGEVTGRASRDFFDGVPNETMLRLMSREDRELLQRRQQGIDERRAHGLTAQAMGQASEAYRIAGLPDLTQLQAGPDGPVLPPDAVPGGGRAPIGVPQGYVAETPNTRGSLGGGSADALERRAQARPRFDEQGQIVAEDGRPLLEVGPDGRMRVRTDRDGNPLRPAQSSTTTRAPLYHDGDELYWAGRSREEIGRVQARLADAGLISPDDRVMYGFWDQTTLNAYTTLLGYANQTGTTWTEAASEMRELRQAGLADYLRNRRQELEAQLTPFRAPDPAEVRETVRQAVSQYLGGHDVSLRELADIMAGFEASFREEWEAGNAVERAAIEQQLALEADPLAGVPAEFGGTPPPAQTPVTQVQGVNPEARLAEAIRGGFAEERASLDQQAASEGATATLHGSVGRLLARTRGGL